MGPYLSASLQNIYTTSTRTPHLAQAEVVPAPAVGRGLPALRRDAAALALTRPHHAAPAPQLHVPLLADRQQVRVVSRCENLERD